MSNPKRLRPPHAREGLTQASGEREMVIETRASSNLRITSPVQRRIPLGNQALRLGGKISPVTVSAVMRAADTGYVWQLMDLGDELKQKDAHLGTVCFRRETAPTQLDYQIVPTSERPKALRIAAFVTEALKRFGEIEVDGADVYDFSKTIAHLNGATFYGHGVSEMLWQKDGRYVLPGGAIPIQPRRFVYGQADGIFRWWDATYPNDPYPGVDIRKDYATGKFLIHRPRINGSIGPREGLIRPLVWAAVFRTWSISDWLKLAELAWKPYRTGEYSRDNSPASSEDRIALEEALESITTNGFAALPSTTKLKVEYAKGRSGGGTHGDLAGFFAAEMSKYALGATLGVEQGRVGSNALGRVHANVAREILEFDARALEGTIQRYIIVPLVRKNFGPNVEVPQFRFLTEESADLAMMAEAIQRLTQQGLRVPQRWVRAMFGMPDPIDDEETMGGPVLPPGNDDTLLPAEPKEPTGDPADPDDATGKSYNGDLSGLVSDAQMRSMLGIYSTHRILSGAGYWRFKSGVAFNRSTTVIT